MICFFLFQLQQLVVSGELACSKEEAASLACIQLRIEETWKPPCSTQSNSLAPPSTPCLNINSPTNPTVPSSSSTSSSHLTPLPHSNSHLGQHQAGVGSGGGGGGSGPAFVFGSGGGCGVVKSSSTISSLTGQSSSTHSSCHVVPPPSPAHRTFLSTPSQQHARVSLTSFNTLMLFFKEGASSRLQLSTNIIKPN